jgi:acetoin utilization deacetylase AcuC-like enzyme
MGPYHPECPERLDAVQDRLISSGLDALIEHHLLREAPSSHFSRLHAAHYMYDNEEASPESGVHYLDPDTALNPDSLDAARHGAGALILATDLVVGGKRDTAFCAVRPPGHHATRDRAMGFCLFNNVAVGVAHALEHHGLKRAAVVDFDVHHGNGTEDIFAGDDRVVMTGTFQYPLYPYSGVDPLGPNMHNVPLSPGSGSDAFRKAFVEVCLPALEAHRPEIIFVSAGFDAHREDPLANLQLTDDDYCWVTSRIAEVAARHGPVASYRRRRRLPRAECARSQRDAHVRVLAGLGP